MFTPPLNINIIEELTPCQTTKTIHVERREKTKFDFPLHTHEEMELNLLVGCKGALRVVGDSITELDDLDLTLVGPNVPHGWLQHKCKSRKIKEITIQFPSINFHMGYLEQNNIGSLYSLVKNSTRGVTFDYETILENYAAIKQLSNLTNNFEKLMSLSWVMFNLSTSGNQTLLASEAFSENPPSNPSRRITKVQQYINAHFSERIKLGDLAEIAGMTIQSFSKFFKQSTSRTVGQFMLDVRMGVASRLLITTLKSISEICYECGFNNVSHFCRTFRQYKGYTPGEFRQLYLK